MKDELRAAFEFVRETNHLLHQKKLNVCFCHFKEILPSTQTQVRTQALIRVLIEIQRRLMVLLVEVDHEQVVFLFFLYSELTARQMVSSSLLLNDCIQSLLAWHDALSQGTVYKAPEIDMEAALRRWIFSKFP